MPDLHIDADGHLASDLRCAGCTYNLRGRPVEGECPECGQPVSTAITYAIASGRFGVVSSIAPPAAD